MARVNISIPDSLYERLDRLRDRVNASKVCASALERELNMIEGRAAIADPEIAQLVQRLQSTKERWYKRGREDGKRWAVQFASRQQLWRVYDEVHDEEGPDLAEWLTRRHGQRRRLFGSYDFEAAISRWAREDQPTADFRIEQEDEDEEDEEDEDGGRARGGQEVDLAGYMEGWRDVVTEVWQVVSAALR
jgi:hypothetical protein